MVYLHRLLLCILPLRVGDRMRSCSVFCAQVGSRQAHGAFPGPALGESPHEIAFREVNFAERVREFVEEDESFLSAEKVAASEGRRNVLRLLYQLCPGAAPKSQPAPRKACDFEGLYVASDSAQVAEDSPTLFH